MQMTFSSLAKVLSTLTEISVKTQNDLPAINGKQDVQTYIVALI